MCLYLRAYGHDCTEHKYMKWKRGPSFFSEGYPYAFFFLMEILVPTFCVRKWMLEFHIKKNVFSLSCG